MVEGLLTLDPFRQIYIADLDAIEGRGDHSDSVALLEKQFPQVEFWLDAGVATQQQATALLGRHRGDLVLGSESLSDTHLLESLRRSDRILLSLDFRGEAPLGPPDLFDRTELWPQRMIVMTLARVGAGLGPDFDRLAAFAKQAPQHRIYAAGGVRNRQDLVELRRIGLAGVLVASALHDGQLQAADLQPEM